MRQETAQASLPLSHNRRYVKLQCERDRRTHSAHSGETMALLLK